MATDWGGRVQEEQQEIHSREADTNLEEEHHKACHEILDLTGILGVQNADLVVDMDNETDCGSGKGVEAVADETDDAPGSVAGAEQQVLVEVGSLLELEELSQESVVAHSILCIASAN